MLRRTTVNTGRTGRAVRKKTPGTSGHCRHALRRLLSATRRPAAQGAACAGPSIDDGDLGRWRRRRPRHTLRGGDAAQGSTLPSRGRPGKCLKL